MATIQKQALNDGAVYSIVDERYRQKPTNRTIKVRRRERCWKQHKSVGTVYSRTDLRYFYLPHGQQCENHHQSSWPAIAFINPAEPIPYRGPASTTTSAIPLTLLRARTPRMAVAETGRLTAADMGDRACTHFPTTGPSCRLRQGHPAGSWWTRGVKEPERAGSLWLPEGKPGNCLIYLKRWLWLPRRNEMQRCIYSIKISSVTALQMPMITGRIGDTNAELLKALP